MKDAIITALCMIFISQAIISQFKPVQQIWFKFVGKPWRPEAPPILLVPFTCGPCFAFWSTLITTAVTSQDLTILHGVGLASFSFIASKLIHKLINR